MRSLSLMLLAILTLSAGGPAGAADLRSERAIVAEERLRVPVVIDDLFLQHPGCRTDRNCIAPRILPIEYGRRAGIYRTITVPVDPRFANDYRR